MNVKGTQPMQDKGTEHVLSKQRAILARPEATAARGPPSNTFFVAACDAYGYCVPRHGRMPERPDCRSGHRLPRGPRQDVRRAGLVQLDPRQAEQAVRAAELHGVVRP